MKQKKINTISILILFLTISLNVSSQASRKAIRNFEKAKSAFMSRNYPEAINFANQALDADSLFFDSHLLLADVYQSLDSTKLEISHLKFVWNYQQPKNALVGFRLGEALYKSGDYSNCLIVLTKSLILGNISTGRRTTINHRIESCKFAIEAMKNPVSGKGEKLGSGVNTKADEYWPSLNIEGNTLIFTRLVKPDSSSRFKQEDFFISHNEGRLWKKAEPLANINSPENEGAQTLSTDGNILFFTACNRPDGKGSCDIYFSRKINGQWEEPRNAGKPVNSASWESQPSLSANAGWLYFASNRRGGKGKSDIWRCRLAGFNEEGKPLWGKPENLGDSINTPGAEISPYIHFNGRDLYFSSDYLTGMGGKDIFHSSLKSNGQWSKPENLGFPINTLDDEQGLIIDAAGKTAFYASNRDGNMDIFSFELYPSAQPVPATWVKGIIENVDSGERLVAEVEVVGLTGGAADTVRSNSMGEFILTLPLRENYAFSVSKQGYLFYSELFNLKEVSEATDPYLLEIGLQPIKVGATQVLRNIYFETDSYELMPESFPELQKLKNMLLENPGISVEIEGHTDNTGTADYNQELSEKRAQSVYNYLIGSGIGKESLSYKGYGDGSPVASNDTEKGRSMNRRTEIKIIKID